MEVTSLTKNECYGLLHKSTKNILKLAKWELHSCFRPLSYHTRQVTDLTTSCNYEKWMQT